MYCPKCGSQYKEGDKFCGNCETNFENSKMNDYENNKDNQCVDFKANNAMFAWIMALIPLFGTLIGLIIGFGYTCMVLNIIFCYIDENNLKKQGINTDTFGDMTWLVPYYLYKRAKVLNDSLAYFVVWCVLFALTIFI